MYIHMIHYIDPYNPHDSSVSGSPWCPGDRSTWGGSSSKCHAKFGLGRWAMFFGTGRNNVGIDMAMDQ